MYIKTITEFEELNTPARVNRFTGNMQTSKKHYRAASKTGRTFFNIHEQGHVVKKTDNEIIADNYAIDYMLPRGYSLKEIQKTAIANLDKNNPVHVLRLNNIFQRMAQYDYFINNNQKMKNYIINPNFQELTEEKQNEFSNFSLVPKIIKQQLNARNERKEIKAEAKADKIRAKGEAKIIRAEAKQTRAENGEPGFLEKAGNLVGGLFNKGGDTGDTLPTVTEEKNNTTIYIIVGVVVVIIIVGVVIFIKKKKK